MNSHQSLAEALETCKYNENFMGQGTVAMATLPKPNQQQHKKANLSDPLPHTVASLDLHFSVTSQH